MSKWTHPVHARGVPSPRLDSAHVGKLLSDKQIHEYAKLGYYGSENQTAAVAKDSKKKTKTSVSKLLKQLLGL